MKSGDIREAIKKAKDNEDKDRVIHLQEILIDYLEKTNDTYFKGWMQKWDELERLNTPNISNIPKKDIEDLVKEIKREREEIKDLENGEDNRNDKN